MASEVTQLKTPVKRIHAPRKSHLGVSAMRNAREDAPIEDKRLTVIRNQK